MEESMMRRQEAWYFSHSKERSLKILAELGLAKFIDSSKWKVGYAITKDGRAVARGESLLAKEPR
jgi:hypothetical protein